MKTVLITGAASGLGKSLAKEFDKIECRLVLADINRVDEKEYRNEVLALNVDLRDEKAIILMYEKALRKFKKIDIVINNAGITEKKPFYEFTAKEIDSIMDVNARAVFLSTIQAYKNMNEGVIATIVSLGGWFSPRYYSVYSASKHALEGYMKSVRREMDKPIRIKKFHPFRLDTDLNKKAKIKSPGKHRLNPELYAQYVVASVSGNIVKAFIYSVRNCIMWLKKLIF